MDIRADDSSRPRFPAYSTAMSGPEDMGRQDMPPSIDLRRIAKFIKRRAAMVVNITIIGCALSAYAGLVLMPSYTALALLEVNLAAAGPQDRAADDAMDTQLAMLRSAAFRARAFEALSNDPKLHLATSRYADFDRSLQAMQELRSHLIGVSYNSKSPELAAQVVNTVVQLYLANPELTGVRGPDSASEALAKRISALEAALAAENPESAPTQVGASAAVPEAASSAVPRTAQEIADMRVELERLRLERSLAEHTEQSKRRDLALAPPVKLLALAETPRRPSSTSPLMVIFPGTVASAILGLALAVLLGRMGGRIYDAEDLKWNFSAPCLGSIPDSLPGANLATTLAPIDSVGFLRAVDDIVATKILTGRDPRRVLLVTSPAPDRRQFDLAFEVCRAAARFGRTTLLIDLDTTRPNGRGLPWRPAKAQKGVFDVLAQRCSFEAALRKFPGGNLDLLRCEAAPTDDVLKLFANGSLGKLVDLHATAYDCVIINGPPVARVSETLLLAPLVEGAILLVRSGETREDQARESLDTLRSAISSANVNAVEPLVSFVIVGASKRKPSLWSRKGALLKLVGARALDGDANEAANKRPKKGPDAGPTGAGADSLAASKGASS